MVWLNNIFSLISDLKKSSNKIALIALAALPVFIALTVFLTRMQNDYFSGSNSGIYTLGEYQIPSIAAVVGKRDFQLLYRDRFEFTYEYMGMNNPIEDIDKYVDCLVNEYGYVVIKSDDILRLSLQNDSSVIVIDIILQDYGYTIYARKGAK